MISNFVCVCVLITGLIRQPYHTGLYFCPESRRGDRGRGRGGRGGGGRGGDMNDFRGRRDGDDFGKQVLYCAFV